jgi:hypothetical protein
LTWNLCSLCEGLVNRALTEQSNTVALGLFSRESTSYADVLQSVIMYPDLLMFKKAQKIAVEVMLISSLSIFTRVPSCVELCN